jgi:hypothetical protein
MEEILKLFGPQAIAVLIVWYIINQKAENTKEWFRDFRDEMRDALADKVNDETCKARHQVIITEAIKRNRHEQ